MGPLTWKPKLLTIKDVDGQFVRICSYDTGIVLMLAAYAGLNVKAKDRPSICHCPGLADLKRIRNQAQSDDMCTDVKPDLFDDESAPQQPQKKKKRIAHRTHQENKELKDNVGAFLVKLDDTHSAWLKRPIHACEDIIVKFEEDSLTNVFQFIVDGGLDMENLYTKRPYRDRATGVRDPRRRETIEEPMDDVSTLSDAGEG